MHIKLTIPLFLLSFTALMGGVKTPESPVLLSWAVKEEFVVDAHGASTRVKISHAEDASGNKRIFITDVGSIRYLLKGAFALTDDMAHHKQLLDDLLTFVQPIGKLLETPIKNKINALSGSNKIQFLKDLAETKAFGRSMDEVTEGIVDAYSTLISNPVLRKDFFLLQKVSVLKTLNVTFQTLPNGRINIIHPSDGRVFAYFEDQLIYEYGVYGGVVRPRPNKTTTFLGKAVNVNPDADGHLFGTYKFIGAVNDSRLVSLYPNGDFARIPDIKMGEVPARGDITSLDIDNAWEPMYQDLLNNVVTQGLPAADITEIQAAGLDRIAANLLREKKFWAESNNVRLEDSFKRGYDNRLLSNPTKPPETPPTSLVPGGPERTGFFAKEMDAIEQVHQAGGVYGVRYIKNAAGSYTTVELYTITPPVNKPPLKLLYNYYFDSTTNTFKKS